MSDETKGPKPPLRLVPDEKRIVVPVTAKIEGYLAELVDTGLYGQTPADAARRLIERGLEDFLAAQGGDE